MSEYKLVTHVFTEDPFKVIITQNYSEEFDMGHYQYAIFEGEHIVSANRSYGGPYEGRADATLGKKLLDTYKHYLHL